MDTIQPTLDAKAIRATALDEAAAAMRPVLRNMISRGEAADTILALKEQPPKEVKDALESANAENKKLRREKFDLERKVIDLQSKFDQTDYHLYLEKLKNQHPGMKPYTFEEYIARANES